MTPKRILDEVKSVPENKKANLSQNEELSATATLHDTSKIGNLLNAVSIKDHEMVKMLLKNGANADFCYQSNGINVRPLSLAISQESTEIIKILLQNGAKIDRDIFADAIVNGSVKSFEAILKHGGSEYINSTLHSEVGEGEYPLHYAARLGYMEMVQILLKFQTNINQQTKNGHTALSMAIMKNNYPIVEELLNFGADVQGAIPMPNGNRMPYLIQACVDKHLKLVKLLLKHGVDVNAAYTSSNLTALHYLTVPIEHPDQIAILLELLKHGADVNKASNDFWSPLHSAAETGNSEVMKHLLNHNANIHATDVDNDTPLHIAAKYGNVSCVTMLLERGCKIDMKNYADESPLHVAVESESREIVSQLLDNGAEVNAQDCEGQTPLHNAILAYSEDNEKECLAIVKLLLEEPIDLNLTDVDGNTALELAFEKKCSDIIKMMMCAVFPKPLKSFL